MSPAPATPAAAPRLDDRAFVAQFRAGTLGTDHFHHRDHVRMAWLYVRDHGLETAVTRFTDDLRAFATAKGVPLVWTKILEKAVKATTATVEIPIPGTRGGKIVCSVSILAMGRARRVRSTTTPEKSLSRLEVASARPSIRPSARGPAIRTDDR